MRQLLPRFLLVIVAAPAAFVAVFVGGAHTRIHAEPAAALVAAMTFAAIVLAPSTKNAAVRAGLAIAAVAVGVAVLQLFE